MVNCCTPPVKRSELQTVVSFERESRVSDGAGGFTRTWAAISGASTRARVKAMSGAERYHSDRIEASARFRLTCRYFSGLKEADTVVINGTRYNIRFINNLDLADRWYIIDLDGGVAT